MIIDEVLVNRFATPEPLVYSMPMVNIVFVHSPAEIDLFAAK
jgi:hypothetical protein